MDQFCMVGALFSIVPLRYGKVRWSEVPHRYGKVQWREVSYWYGKVLNG